MRTFNVYLKDEGGNVVASFSSEADIIVEDFPDGWTIERDAYHAEGLPPTPCEAAHPGEPCPKA